MAAYELGLPVPLAGLPRLLSRELTPHRPRPLAVTSVDAARVPGLRLLIGVVAGHDAQMWELTLDLPEPDLESLDPYSFVVTVRANLEEWWDTRTPDYDVLPARKVG